MLTRFTRTVKLLLQHLSARDKVVRRTMIMLMPGLAVLSPTGFVRGCLAPTMESLLKSMDSQNASDVKERAAAFLAVGDIAHSIGPAIIPSLAKTVDLATKALRKPTRRGAMPICPEVNVGNMMYALTVLCDARP